MKQNEYSRKMIVALLYKVHKGIVLAESEQKALDTWKNKSRVNNQLFVELTNKDSVTNLLKELEEVDVEGSLIECKRRILRGYTDCRTEIITCNILLTTTQYLNCFN